MKYVDDELLIPKMSIEYYVLKKKIKENQKTKIIESEVPFEHEDISMDENTTDKIDFQYVSNTFEKEVHDLSEEMFKNGTLIKKSGLEYKLLHLFKKNLDDVEKEEDDTVFRHKKTNKELEEYKKWGETQFDGKGIEVDDTEHRMIGFSKERIRKVKL